MKFIGDCKKFLKIQLQLHHKICKIQDEITDLERGITNIKNDASFKQIISAYVDYNNEHHYTYYDIDNNSNEDLYNLINDCNHYHLDSFVENNRWNIQIPCPFECYCDRSDCDAYDNHDVDIGGGRCSRGRKVCIERHYDELPVGFINNVDESRFLDYLSVCYY